MHRLVHAVPVARGNGQGHGPGAVAAALTMAALGKVKAPVDVRTRGGDTLIVGFYMSDQGFCDVSLTGDASIVYEGTLDQSEG